MRYSSSWRLQWYWRWLSSWWGWVYGYFDWCRWFVHISSLFGLSIPPCSFGCHWDMYSWPTIYCSFIASVALFISNYLSSSVSFVSPHPSSPHFLSLRPHIACPYSHTNCYLYRLTLRSQTYAHFYLLPTLFYFSLLKHHPQSNGSISRQSWHTQTSPRLSSSPRFPWLFPQCSCFLSFSARNQW